MKKKKIYIDEETEVNLLIWDTQGEEKFMSVTNQYYADSHGIMILFDLSKKYSFLKIDKLIKDVKCNAPKDVVIMIIGIKTYEQSLDLENELQSYKDKYLYCEVNIKTGTNVSLAFENLTLKILENLREKKILLKENIERRDIIPLSKIKEK